MAYIVAQWAALTGKGDLFFQRMDAFNVVAEQSVVAQVGVKPREIVRIGKVDVVAMLDVHIPTHKAHLEAENSRIPPVIR
jgi:hypothetical protein